MNPARALLAVTALAGVALASRKPAASFLADTRAGMREREGQLRAQLARDTQLSLVGELAQSRAIEGR